MDPQSDLISQWSVDSGYEWIANLHNSASHGVVGNEYTETYEENPVGNNSPHMPDPADTLSKSDMDEYNAAGTSPEMHSVDLHLDDNSIGNSLALGSPPSS